jgi:hypothetical protein
MTGYKSTEHHQGPVTSQIVKKSVVKETPVRTVGVGFISTGSTRVGEGSWLAENQTGSRSKRNSNRREVRRPVSREGSIRREDSIRVGGSSVRREAGSVRRQPSEVCYGDEVRTVLVACNDPHCLLDHAGGENESTTEEVSRLICVISERDEEICR